MSSRSKSRSNSQASYTRRINRVVNHLAANPAERLNIAELAALAHFSDFHFHRLFKAYTGETPAELARRLRLERAAADLIYHRAASITDLALTLGFSSSANFTKAFTAHFGVAPSRYAASSNRSRTSRHQSKDSKPGKAETSQPKDTSLSALIGRSKPSFANPGMDVVIQEQPLVHLAYLRHVGPYQPEIISALFAQLTAWAKEQLPKQPAAQTLGITWSDSSVAEPQTWRYDAAMVVPAETRASDGVDRQTLGPGNIAVLKLTVTPPDYSPIAQAWDFLLAQWLPSSGWQPADQPSFERYDQGSSGEHSQIALCLPIQTIR